MEKHDLEQIIQEALESRPELFLVSWSLGDENDVEVIIDGDNDVTIEDIVDISRKIEHDERIDREEFDFSLSVLSSGADSPIVFPRQWNKNIGRTLLIDSEKNGNLEAELVKVSDKGIELTWQARENKAIGKGKCTVTKQLELPFEEIKNAVIKLKYTLLT